MHSIAKTARHQRAHRQVVTWWRGDATQLWDGDDLGGLQHVWKYISCHRNRFDSIFLFCFVWRCHSHIQIWFMLLSVVVKKNVGENALDPMKCQSGRVFLAYFWREKSLDFAGATHSTKVMSMWNIWRPMTQQVSRTGIGKQCSGAKFQIITALQMTEAFLFC